jgi:CarboxypepD_reg-like domain
MPGKFFLILVFVALNSPYGYSHDGLILDQNTRQPLAFVNIGIPGKNIGTVSLINGYYSIDFQGYINDTIRFSMVGYEAREISIKHLPDTIFLKPDNTLLEEVLVRSKKLRKGFLGNKTSSKLIYGGYRQDYLGAELGTLMKIRRAPTFINSFHFFISFNDYDSLRFRVNIYEMDGKKVGKRILHRNVIIEEAVDGWNHVNLEPYNVVARRNFLVSLEWLTDFPCQNIEIDSDGKEVQSCQLMFSAGFFNADLYYRTVSQGEFKKFGTAGVGFNVGVEY